MGLLTNTDSFLLWKDVVKHAEDRCSIALKTEIESYLVSLLDRYTSRPEVVKEVLATAFLEALHLQERMRQFSLQNVGDQCLLFAGLFPQAAKKRHVKITYFVDLGQAAYSAVSKTTDDLYSSLALQFVVLMDVLQSIRPGMDLLPLEAYEQWAELGSKRALQILQAYTTATPLKFTNK